VRRGSGVQAGVGVMQKGLRQRQGVGAPLRDVLMDAVAFAALGTVADVVPLHAENRIFGRHGLARLQHRPADGPAGALETANLPHQAGADRD